MHGAHVVVEELVVGGGTDGGEGQYEVKYRRRVVDEELDELMSELPAIALEGPRGVGKTATAERRARTAHYLDDPAQRAVAEADPTLMLSGDPPVLIDEWQRVPGGPGCRAAGGGPRMRSRGLPADGFHGAGHASVAFGGGSDRNVADAPDVVVRAWMRKAHGESFEAAAGRRTGRSVGKHGNLPRGLCAGDRAFGPQIPREATLLGHLFESLVTLSIRVFAQAGEARVRHLRTHGGRQEVDLIVERADQRVVAFEVKLGGVVANADVKHLLWLRRQLGDDLLDAAVVHTGPQAYRRTDGIAVIPAALLGA